MGDGTIDCRVCFGPDDEEEQAPAETGWFRRFRIGYTEVARKNGKSTLAAGVGLLLAFYDDEPGAEVFCSATKRDQAKLIWGEAQRMVRSSPELRGDIKVLVGNLHSGNSKFMPLGADEDSTDGTQQVARWIDLDLWDANAGTVDEADLAGRECYGMLDLATVSDMTAWVMGFPSEVGRKFGSHICDDECLDIVARFWCPEAKLTDPSNRYADQYRVWRDKGALSVTVGNATDFAFVQAQILKDAQMFRLIDMNVDRLFQAHQIAGTLADEGIKIFGLGMGFLGMAAPMAEFHRRLLGHKVHHGGNPILRWMADNVAVKQDPAGNLKPDKATSQGRIDGIIGTGGVIDRVMRHETAEVGVMFV